MRDGAISDGTLDAELSVGAYERERLARIERNRVLMEKLGVTPLAQQLDSVLPTRPSTLKPVGQTKRARKAADEALRSDTGVDQVAATPRRRSLRVRGIAPEGSREGPGGLRPDKEHLEDEKKPTGPVLEDQKLVDIALLDYGAGPDVSDNDEASEPDDDSSVRKRRVRAFQLAWNDLPVSSATNSASKAETTLSVERFKRWSLDEQTGFLKLVPARIYSAVMLPRTDAWAVAVGDKIGHVGIAVTTSGLEGMPPVHVLSTRVHRDTTSGLATIDQSSTTRRLLSVSYDGSARVLDLEKEMVQTVLVDDRERILKTVVPSSLNEHVFWTTASHRSLGGFLIRNDLRQDQKSFDIFPVAENRVYSVDLQQNCRMSAGTGDGSLVAVTTARDGVLVFDVRRMETGASRRAAPKAVFTLPHDRAVTAANWSPSGTRLLTTCYDDFLRIWHYDGNNFPLEYRFAHNNHTGRWVTPFDARWDPITDHKLFACGSMNHSPEHGVDLFHTELNRRSVWRRLTGDPMTAIAAVLAWHPAGLALAGCTASGRVYIWGETSRLAGKGVP